MAIRDWNEIRVEDPECKEIEKELTDCVDIAEEQISKCRTKGKVLYCLSGSRDKT
jgi:hypothetical protein